MLERQYPGGRLVLASSATLHVDGAEYPLHQIEPVDPERRYLIVDEFDSYPSARDRDPIALNATFQRPSGNRAARRRAAAARRRRR